MHVKRILRREFLALWLGLFSAAVFAQAPEVKERFKQLGLVIVGNSPQEFSAVVKRDVEKFRKVIIESGIARL